MKCFCHRQAFISFLTVTLCSQCLTFRDWGISSHTLDHTRALNHVNREIGLTANLLSNGKFLICVYFDGDDERKYFLFYYFTMHILAWESQNALVVIIIFKSLFLSFSFFLSWLQIHSHYFGLQCHSDFTFLLGIRNVGGGERWCTL